MSDFRSLPSWRLLLRYDRIWKAEHKEEAIQLAKLVAHFNGKLTCVKNSDRLVEGLARQKGRIPWVFMTDFRGLVPCINVLDNSTPCDPLMFMIVCCQQDRQLEKAWDRVVDFQQIRLSKLNTCLLVYVAMGSPVSVFQEAMQQKIGSLEALMAEAVGTNQTMSSPFGEVVTVEATRSLQYELDMQCQAVEEHFCNIETPMVIGSARHDVIVEACPDFGWDCAPRDCSSLQDFPSGRLFQSMSALTLNEDNFGTEWFTHSFANKKVTQLAADIERVDYCDNMPDEEKMA